MKIKNAMMLALLMVFSFSASTAFAGNHEYVGSKKCGICHKRPEVGGQLGIWQASAHAKAFETLGTPAAKEAAAKLGIDNPQTSGKCLKCHSTAYANTENRVSQVIAVEEGVSCESCHGAGKDYMKKSVMENKDQAIAAGLVLPDEKTCTTCHNSESPTFKSFNYQESWAKIQHPNPSKKK